MFGRGLIERSRVPAITVSGTPTDGQVAIWTDADTVEGSAMGVLMVAANDATAAEKAAALASGGAICDGTDDWDDIETAITASGNGLVQLSSGQFELDQGAVEAYGAAAIQGMGGWYGPSPAAGTILNLAANGDGIDTQLGGKLKGVAIRTPTSFSGVALKIQSVTTSAQYNTNQKVLDDVAIYGDRTNQTGTGLLLKTDSSGNFVNSIELCTFTNVIIDGYDTGLHLWCARDSGDAASYLNGNTFIGLNIAACKHLIVQQTSGTGAPQLTGNKYLGSQLNCNTLTEDMIYLDVDSGAQQGNEWLGTSLWDITHLSGSPAMIMESGASYNFVSGMLSEELPTGAGLYNGSFDTFNPSFTYRQKPPTGIPSGERIVGTLGATVVAGDLVYLNTSDKWALADADAEATAKGQLGLVIQGGGDTDLGLIHLRGPFKLTGWSWNEGVPLFISTTAGDFTETAPSGASDIVRVIGNGMEDADVIFFNPSPDWFEHDGTGINKINGIAINV